MPVMFPPGRHESRRDRVESAEHDDGNRRRRGLGRPDARTADRDDDIDSELHQVARQRRKPVELALGVSPFDDEVLAFDVAQLAQGPRDPGRRRPLVRWQRGCLVEQAQAVDPSRLLRRGAKRHDEKAEADAANERPAVHHWITSSALSKSDCGMVRPRALAVLRLMTSSNLVGCSIARSWALAPFRILSM
jgi:hypothetical protein